MVTSHDIYKLFIMCREDILVITSIQYQSLYFYLLSESGKLKKLRVVGSSLEPEDEFVIQEMEVKEQQYQKEKSKAVSYVIKQCDCPIVDMVGKCVVKVESEDNSTNVWSELTSTVYDVDNAIFNGDSEFESEVDDPASLPYSKPVLRYLFAYLTVCRLYLEDLNSGS